MLQQGLKNCVLFKEHRQFKEFIPVFNRKEFHFRIRLQFSKVKNTEKFRAIFIPQKITNIYVRDCWLFAKKDFFFFFFFQNS